jgi:hypothetical protein
VDAGGVGAGFAEQLGGGTREPRLVLEPFRQSGNRLREVIKEPPVLSGLERIAHVRPAMENIGERTQRSRHAPERYQADTPRSAGALGNPHAHQPSSAIFYPVCDWPESSAPDFSKGGVRTEIFLRSEL